MKLVYKFFLSLARILRKAFSAYKDYCCRKAERKRVIILLEEDSRMARVPISLAKTRAQAMCLGYASEEWDEYVASIQSHSDETSPEVIAQENEEVGGDDNV